MAAVEILVKFNGCNPISLEDVDVGWCDFETLKTVENRLDAFLTKVRSRLAVMSPTIPRSMREKVVEERPSVILDPTIAFLSRKKPRN